MYQSVEHGGLGCPRLSDSINTAKISNQLRHLHLGGEISSVMDALNYNAVVKSSQVPLSSTGVILYPQEKADSTLWASSMVQFSAEAGMFLCRQGPFPARSAASSLITASMPSNRPQPWCYVNDRHISQLGDLYSYISGSTPTWHDFSTTAGHAMAEIQLGSPPSDPVCLRSDQFWLPMDTAESIFPRDTIVEILGFTHDDPPLVNIRKWRTNDGGSVARTKDVYLSKYPPLMGGATGLSLFPAEALGLTPSRIYLNPLSNSYRQIGFISSPTVYTIPTPCSLPQEDPPPVLTTPLPDSPPHWFPLEDLKYLASHGPISIYSDGSWSPRGSSWPHIVRTSPPYAGSVGLAIVSNTPEWKDLPIITVPIINGQNMEALSAYSMEVLGILTALSISAGVPHTKVTIYSDCQSAVTKLRNIKNNKYTLRAKTRDVSLLAAAISHWNSLSNTNICWVKGHPEKKEPDASLWTRKMWGNHLSDRTAAGVLNGTTEYQYQNLYSNLLILTPQDPLDAMHLSQKLAPNGLWYYGTDKGQLLSPSIIDRIQTRRLCKYLNDRDTQRFNRAKLPSKWKYFNMPLAAKLWKMSAPNLRNMKNRLIYDKHCHPGNMSKKIKDPVLYTLASKCPFCPSHDSQAHWTVQCTAVPRTTQLRTEAISNIKSLVKTVADSQDNADSKTAIYTLRDNYLSLLTGPKKSPEVWMGLWTDDQLDDFGATAYYPGPLVSILKKLFYNIGSILADAIMTIWKSRQQAEVELAMRHATSPIPGYIPPLHLMKTTELAPHTYTEMSAIVESAAISILPSQKVNNSAVTKRKLRVSVSTVSTTTVYDTSAASVGPNVTACDTSFTNEHLVPSPQVVVITTDGGIPPPPPLTVAPSNAGGVSAPTEEFSSSSGDGLVSLLSLAPSPNVFQFKQSTYKKRKAPPPLSVQQRFDRHKRDAPLTLQRKHARDAATRATVPITSILKAQPGSKYSSSKIKETRSTNRSLSSPKKPKKSSVRSAVLPPSPPPPTLPPLEGVVDVSRSSSRMVACQSPIRGHDPG